LRARRRADPDRPRRIVAGSAAGAAATGGYHHSRRRIPKTNPELVEARRRGQSRVMLRPAVLAKLDGPAEPLLMVTGTHGKNDHDVEADRGPAAGAARDPSFRRRAVSWARAGTKRSPRQRRLLSSPRRTRKRRLACWNTPRIVAKWSTNIESDHLDFFGKSRRPTSRVFDFLRGAHRPRRCARRLQLMDPGRSRGWARSHCGRWGIRVLRYGLVVRRSGTTSWPGRCCRGKQQGTEAVATRQARRAEIHPWVMRLSVPGRPHGAQRAWVRWLAAHRDRCPRRLRAGTGWPGFEGVRRRFELIGTTSGVRVFSTTMRHHPTEVSATLEAVRTPAGADRRRPLPGGVPAAFCIRGPRLFAAEFGAGARTGGRSGFRARRLRRTREQPIAGVSGAGSVAEHVSVPGAVSARFLVDRRGWVAATAAAR